MTTTDVSLPRYWKREIAAITGLNYCDRDCGCGENNQLWWSSVPGSTSPDWVPGWMNGADGHTIWRWLVKHGKVPPRRARRRRI